MWSLLLPLVQMRGFEFCALWPDLFYLCETWLKSEIQLGSVSDSYYVLSIDEELRILLQKFYSSHSEKCLLFALRDIWQGSFKIYYRYSVWSCWLCFRWHTWNIPDNYNFPEYMNDTILWISIFSFYWYCIGITMHMWYCYAYGIAMLWYYYAYVKYR